MLVVLAAAAGCAGTPIPAEERATPAPATPQNSAFRCPSGEAVVGFSSSGVPACEPFAPVRAPTPARFSADIKVVNVYGTRMSATADLSAIRIVVQLTSDSIPLDVQELIVRYFDGTNVPGHLVWEAFDGTPSSAAVFQASWVRGDPDGTAGNSVMVAGDLVELSFVIAPGEEIAERSPIAVSLIPNSGDVYTADFVTPATYGDDLTITLR